MIVWAPVPSVVALGDCEAVREGLLAQPVNSWSSLAFVVGGLWVLLWFAHSRLTVRLFGAALVVAGLGSVAYHGPGGTLAQFTHDVGLAAPLSLLAASRMGALRRWDEARVISSAAGLTAVAALTLRGSASSANVVFAMALALHLGMELLAHLRRVRSTSRVQRGAWRATVGVGLGALVLNLLGRTGASTCAPASWVQPHAGWHVLAALAAVLVGIATFGPHDGAVAVADVDRT